MKKIFINILSGILLFVFITACTEESFGDADASGIPPSIESIEDAISVTVNQLTNQVTFAIEESKMIGLMPVWLFSGGNSDDKASSTVNRDVKIYKKKGEYFVEVKLANKNGIGLGSVVKKFTVERSLVESNLVESLCTNKLFWNYVKDAHFGCGPTWGSEGVDTNNYGLGWWSCNKNGTNMGMYDDSFVFATEEKRSLTQITGTYTYNPGEDGMIGVNAGVTVEPFGAYNPNDGNDFPASVNKQTVEWKMYYDENDVLFLEFPAHTMVGFIPNVEVWNTPKFRVVELTNNKVILVADNGDIAWRYVFVPEAQNAIDDIGGENYADAIVGTWMWNFTQNGHFGCGPDVDSPLGWWSCGANEKADWGMYNDVMSFTETQYTFDPGEDGMIYVNKGCSYHSELKINENDDYMAPAEKQTTTYQVVNEDGNYYLILPTETHFSYMPSDDVFKSPKYLIKRINKKMNIIELASITTDTENQIAWYYQFKRVE